MRFRRVSFVISNVFVHKILFIINDDNEYIYDILDNFWIKLFSEIFWLILLPIIYIRKKGVFKTFSQR